MKTKLLFLSATLVFSASGCEQKIDLANKPAAANQEAKQKIQESVEQVKEVTNGPGKVLPQPTESSQKKSPPIVKETTEQSLADISKHGREVTKTQESKTRTRAQMAEDEMAKDLGKFK